MKKSQDKTKYYFVTSITLMIVGTLALVWLFSYEQNKSYDKTAENNEIIENNKEAIQALENVVVQYNEVKSDPINFVDMGVDLNFDYPKDWKIMLDTKVSDSGNAFTDGSITGPVVSSYSVTLQKEEANILITKVLGEIEVLPEQIQNQTVQVSDKVIRVLSEDGVTWDYKAIISCSEAFGTTEGTCAVGTLPVTTQKPFLTFMSISGTVTEGQLAEADEIALSMVD